MKFKPLLVSVIVAFFMFLYILLNNQVGALLTVQTHLDLLQIFTTLLLIGVIILLSKKLFSLKVVGIQSTGFFRSFSYALVYFACFKAVGVLAFGSPTQLFSHNIGLSYILILMLMAFTEELIFRGLIFRAWEKKHGFLTGLFISFVLFGLSHLISPLANNPNSASAQMLTTPIFALLVGALLGPTFALIAYRTENILGLILVHFLFNVSILTGFLTPQMSLQTMPVWYPTVINLLPIIFPIVVDLFDRKIYPNKKPHIKWGKYLLSIFCLYAITIFSVSAYLVLKEGY